MTLKKPHVYSFSDLLLNEGDDNEDREYKIVKSVDELPSEPKLGDKAYVQFSMFRTGSWDHPWYGRIEFDRSYLEGLVNNFYSGVVPRKIGFDLEHAHSQGDVGNVALMKDLILRDDVIEIAGPNGETIQQEVTMLDVVAELNSEGIRLLKDRRYAHCSAEIHSDFTTNERVKSFDDGEPGLIRHGPTIVGCAFTNRPFIPSLGEVIEFSDRGGKEEELSHYTLSRDEGTGVRFFSHRSFEGTEEALEVLNKEKETPKAESEGVEEIIHNFGEKQMKFSEVLSALKGFSTPAEKIRYLKGVQEKVTEQEKALVDSLIEANEFSEKQQQEADRKIQEAVRIKRQAEEQAKKFSDEKIALEVKLAEAREGAWAERVKRFSSELREAGHHESMIRAATEKLERMESGGREVKFTFSAAEGKTVQEDLIDILRACFEALPTDARLDFSENLEGNQEVEVHPDEPAQKFSEESEPSEEDLKVQARIQAYRDTTGGLEPPAGIVEFLKDDGSIDWAAKDKASRD